MDQSFVFVLLCFVCFYTQVLVSCIDLYKNAVGLNRIYTFILESTSFEGGCL